MVTDFDDRARSWDEDPGKVERGRIVAAKLHESVPLGPETRLLEYGAGTGLTAQELVGDVGPITLADTSEGMRAVMAEKITAGTFPADTRVWNLDLSGEAAPDERFDLIVTVMALHHITDLEPVLNGFAGLLAEGGHLAVVDLEHDEDGSFHRGSPDFEGHHGFRRQDLTDHLEAAGFVAVHFRTCIDMEKEGRLYSLFLATAAKQTSARGRGGSGRHIWA